MTESSDRWLEIIRRQSLTVADILWVKLNRHTVQCGQCATNRKSRLLEAGRDWFCDDAHALNALMEETTTREQALGKNERVASEMGFRRTVFKSFTFEASHRLPNLPAEHQCSRMHGHSWRAEVHVRGNMNEKLGWIVDFGEIKRVVRTFIDKLDHYTLNDIEGLENPTSENVAAWLWTKLDHPLLDIGASLTRLVVQETCTSGAIIDRNDDMRGS